MNIYAISVALASGVLLVAKAAHAQETYPIEVREHLALSYAPPCSLCHEKGNTGSGTVVTPFGWSMRSKGLVVDDGQSVGKALDALRLANADSDGDRVSDIDELVAGTDPNSAGALPMATRKQPGYGCGGEAPDPTGQREAGIAWPVVVLVALALRRGRRTR